MHWDQIWQTGWFGIHVPWWVLWLVMAAIVWLIIDRSARNSGGGAK